MSFNVEGLKLKLEDPHCLKFIGNYEISILTETWKADTSKINIEGFWDFSQVRPKHKQAMRHSDGITILAKYNIRRGLKLVENTEGFLWLRLDKTFFKLKNDIFLCGANTPPRNTTLNVNVKTDYFGSLEKPILKSKGKGDIFIMGDLNARTGNKENIHNIKLNEHLKDILLNSDEASKLTKRCSNDLKTNTSGNTSIKVCKNHNLRIANEQTNPWR